jgi:hypothetical protein
MLRFEALLVFRSSRHFRVLLVYRSSRAGVASVDAASLNYRLATPGLEHRNDLCHSAPYQRHLDTDCALGAAELQKVSGFERERGRAF